MMSTQLEKFTWQTGGATMTNVLTTLDVEIRQMNHRPDLFAVIMTERPDNQGSSITNSFEHLATKLHNQRLREVAPEKILWVEHCPPDSFRDHDDYCLVKLSHDGKKYFNPKFAPIPADEYLKLLFTANGDPVEPPKN